MRRNTLKYLYYKFKLRSWINDPIERCVNFRRCYIFLAADYGNLGDVAITYAQRKFLQSHFPNHEVIEVHAASTLRMLRSIKKVIKPEDIVTVVGGGNMGDIYGDIELLRLMVVDTFRDNRIILFPQTIDYSNSKEAEWLKTKSKMVYSRAKRLTMCAREAVSYDTMKQYYPEVDVRLTPDIVMTLDERMEKDIRKDIVTYCLRNDKEKADNAIRLKNIHDYILGKGWKEEYYDTHIGGDRYTEKEKYAELEKIWTQFRRSRLVVTDRLHGMIFAYITGTPAIVLPNSNFKVRECFKWIKNCGYIKLYTDTLTLSVLVDDLKEEMNIQRQIDEKISEILS